MICIFLLSVSSLSSPSPPTLLASGGVARAPSRGAWWHTPHGRGPTSSVFLFLPASLLILSSPAETYFFDGEGVPCRGCLGGMSPSTLAPKKCRIGTPPVYLCMDCRPTRLAPVGTCSKDGQVPGPRMQQEEREDEGEGGEEEARQEEAVKGEG